MTYQTFSKVMCPYCKVELDLTWHDGLKKFVAPEHRMSKLFTVHLEPNDADIGGWTTHRGVATCPLGIIEIEPYRNVSHT